MQYQTIVYELLNQENQLYEVLRQRRQLLPTIETLATELRQHHLELTESMILAQPSEDPSLIPTQSLEIAIKDLQDHLSAALPSNDQEEFSLEVIMAFLSRPLPNA